VIAPVVVLSYALGLKQGPHGVAAGFSLAMALLVVPVVWWAKAGTLITGSDILKTALMPFLAILAGAAVAWGAGGLVTHIQPTFIRLVVETAILFGVYLLVLLFVMKQKSVYLELLRSTGFWKSRGGAKQEKADQPA